ncbi:cytoplasmic polyadenylated homeobox-like [Microtus oregoni]|uniref:cytoplasmic polyadenylated homeobox-like n=1 Tax=Microtus oregoni TaxID=111838 RepID=UPI001BB271D7|nr:cytoplasmic polyadenylated homeobox-like [Microtus oregoni]
MSVVVALEHLWVLLMSNAFLFPHFPGSPDKEDSCSKARTERGRGKLKPRHKFTKDDLKILQQSFEQDRYPDFTTKETLAQECRCTVYVIENWFQNRRARLSKFRDKSFGTKRMHKSQDYILTGHQDTQGQAPNYSVEQVSYHQLLVNAMVQSNRMRSGGAVCYQGTSGTGSSFTFKPTDFTPPPMCVQFYKGD